MLLMVSFKGTISFEGLKKPKKQGCLIGMVREINRFQLVTEKTL